ncbi:M48 family metallopeptidase [Sulfobacillus thermosulfidooxidans]|uniref:M48 family metallopeptidase n=1 Tax=Sulfobacillus thermosulfidooxidans TaxID=28034 RepID=UPI0006B5A491|nr:SprT family zinc-dependent metalloprotease [Sulfobacillus thermosulfidooxidans]
MGPVKGQIIATQEISSGTTRLTYHVIMRPNRRRAALRIEADGSLTVLVPPGYPMERVQSFVQQNIPWILKHHQTVQQYEAKTFREGEVFSFYGEPLTLSFCQDYTWPIVRQENGQLIVGNMSLIGYQDPSQFVRNQLIQWYYEQAVKSLVPRFQSWAQQLGQFPAHVKIHEYRSRWGYCRQDGLIAFNWRIVQAPARVVDYVLVHELTHLSYPHHQKPFWNAVGQILPDYHQDKKWLKDYGHQLQW